MATSARVARDSAGLLAGTLVNGVFAYIFFALATRGLGATAAAPVAVLWTYWGLVTAVITFPVQHWIIRALHADGEAVVARTLPRMAATVTLLAVGATLLTWLNGERLFLRPGFVFPAFVGLVTLGSLFTGIVRGGLAGRERFAATAVALAADNVVRVVLAVAVLRAAGGAVGLGVVLVAGALIGLAWPSGYRFGSRGEHREASSLSFLGAIATGSLLGQLVLVGGPALLPLLGGLAADVTMLFATLALFRAPYLLGVGVANRMTGSLTGWMSGHRHDHVRAFKLAVAALTLGGGSLAALVGYVVGPAVVAAVFGQETTPPSWLAAVVAGGSICAVGNLALSLVVIAHGRGGWLTRAWVVALAVVAVVVVVLRTSPLAAVTWAFLAGEATAFAVLLRAGRAAGGPTVGDESQVGVHPPAPGVVA